MAVGDVFTLDENAGKTLTRIDTKTNWAAANPILAIGEMGIEKDGLLQNIKVGDGVTKWNQLGYMFKSCPYEVGDVLVTTSTTAPSTRWPGTTWETFAPGRVLVGAGTGTDANGTAMTFALNATGGEYSHQLTVGEMPSHRHQLKAGSTYTGDDSEWILGNVESTDSDGLSWRDLNYINYTGNNESHNNMPPYVTVYRYRRTK